MRFKPRLPLSQSPTSPEESPKKSSPPETADEAPAGSDPLSGAFDAISAVLRGEIDSLKRTIADLTAKLEQRMDSERASTSSAIGDLRQEAISRIESLQQSQQKATADLSEQSKTAIAELRARFEREQEQANNRANEIKSRLEQSLNAKEEKLLKELESLSRTLSGVRSDLERQMTTSGQVTSLLNNMAGIFAAGKTLPTVPKSATRPDSSSD